MTLEIELLKWYSLNKRDLPWRKNNDPYRVWVSEIILQQTRITQGKKYFNDFIDKFPKKCFGINYDTGNSASLGFNPIEAAASFCPFPTP